MGFEFFLLRDDEHTFIAAQYFGRVTVFIEAAYKEVGY